MSPEAMQHPHRIIKSNEGGNRLFPIWTLAAVLLASAAVPAVSPSQERIRERTREPSVERIVPEVQLVPPRRGAHPERHWQLGVDARNRDIGVEIVRVLPHSCAARYGLEPGDLIVNVSGFQIGEVDGQLFDMREELCSRADRFGRVSLLVRDNRTGRLANLRVQLDPAEDAVIGAPGLDDVMRTIDRWYHDYLHREPRDVELAVLRRQLQSGKTPQDVQAMLLGSREFYDHHGNNDLQYISALFEDVLHRRPSQEQLRFWLADLDKHHGLRVSFARHFLETVNHPSYHQPVVVENTPPPQTRVTRFIVNQDLRLKAYCRDLALFTRSPYYAELATLARTLDGLFTRIGQLERLGVTARNEQQALATSARQHTSRMLTLTDALEERADDLDRYDDEAERMLRQARDINEQAEYLRRELATRR